MKNFLLLSLLTYALNTNAQQPGTVALENDFYPGGANGKVCGLNVFMGKLALCASSGTSAGGHELYTYDANGVATLFDINPGGADAILYNVVPITMATVGSTIYFAADNGTTGQELFKWDGMNQPTLAFDVNNGPASSEPQSLATLNGKVYFVASVSSKGLELWMYDPATQLANLVSDIYPGSGDAYPRHLTAFNGKLYFTARDASSDHELFVHDPVANTTTMVADYWPGPFGANPTSLMEINGKLYFLATDGSHGRELHVMDAAENITRLTDIEPTVTAGSLLGGHEFFKQIGFYNNALYMIGLEAPNGQALYKYDLSASTMSKVATLNTTPSTWPIVPATSFANYAGKLFFVGDDGTHGQELWAYDGANAPYMVADINPGIDAGDPSFMTAFSNKLYFGATNSALTGHELYSFTDSSLSVKRMKFDGSVSVHPNPAGNSFNISLSIPKTTSLSVAITGIDGRQQLSTPLRRYEAGTSTVSFDASALAAGVYLYTVKNQDGTLCQSGRIVKQ